MVIVFDIDGTLANVEHRLHYIREEKKDWDGFFKSVPDDDPILPTINLAKTLLKSRETRVLFATGRPERTREDTVAWLSKNGISITSPTNLYMRAENDTRPDHMVKEDFLRRMETDGCRPDLVFDDRKSVVEMWRRHGIIVAQVADGNF